MGRESEWEFHKKAWKEQGGQGAKRLAPRTGAELVLATGTGRACGDKGVPALSGHELVTRLH